MTNTPVPAAPVAAPAHGPACEETTRSQVDTLARVLDPRAFAPLPHRPTLGQLWDQISRQGRAEQHAQRALRAGYRRAQDPR